MLIKIENGLLEYLKTRMSDNNEKNGLVVRLNVGGRKFDVLKSTLMEGSAKNSMLSIMLSESYSAPLRDHKGRILLDRDSETFARVLDWLRDGQVRDLDERLHRELCYFGIPTHLDTTPRRTSRFVCYTYWVMDRRNLKWVSEVAKSMMKAASKCHAKARPAFCSEFIESSIEDLPLFNDSGWFLTVWGQNTFCQVGDQPGLKGFCPGVPLSGSSLSTLTKQFSNQDELYLAIAVVLPLHLPWNSSSSSFLSSQENEKKVKEKRKKRKTKHVTDDDNQEE